MLSALGIATSGCIWKRTWNNLLKYRPLAFRHLSKTMPTVIG